MKTEAIQINNKMVSVDLSQLIKADTIMFNATQIAKQFDKRMDNYLRNDSTEEYIQAIISRYAISRNELISIKQGGKYQGTWLHNLLAIDFARWCSPSFAVQLDEWIMNKLEEEKQRKQLRTLSRLEYPDLTNAIQEFLVTGNDSDKWLYSNEADLINKIVLGYKAKQYCELNNIDRVCLRDNLAPSQLRLLNDLQKFDTSMIQLCFSYEERKERLQIRYTQLVTKYLEMK